MNFRTASLGGAFGYSVLVLKASTFLMTSDLALQLLADLFWTGLLVCLPILGITMLVGLVISILQVITQIQEMSLSFEPKLMTAALVSVVLGPWMLRKMTVFTTRLWTSIPNLV